MTCMVHVNGTWHVWYVLMVHDKYGTCKWYMTCMIRVNGRWDVWYVLIVHDMYGTC